MYSSALRRMMFSAAMVELLPLWHESKQDARRNHVASELNLHVLYGSTDIVLAH